MDFNKARCSVCARHFCCPAHKIDHQLKNHSHKHSKRNPDYMVKMFQKKAEKLLFQSQARSKNSEIAKEKAKNHGNSNIVESKPAVKRLHSQRNDRITVTSTTTTSLDRKILVAVHRAPSKLPNRVVEGFGSVSKARGGNEKKISKTSTPIGNKLTVQVTPEMTWNEISAASSIASYRTPQEVLTENNSSGKLTSKVGSAGTAPLRGIISRISKYENERKSPSLNSSRSRRVTFSFSGQLSSNNSQFESIQEEVKIHEEVRDEITYVVGSSNKVVESCTEAEEATTKITKTVAEDSSSSNKDNGFFNCVSKMFCSAVYTIPTFSSWRYSQRNALLNRSKRSRSPELEIAAAPSSLSKRPRYPNDLRLFPIKARRPISNF